jgi:hypothetical protein
LLGELLSQNDAPLRIAAANQGTKPLFGFRKATTPTPSATTAQSIELDSLIAAFGQGADFWDSQLEPGVLVRARLADACRDVRIRPISESQFLACWNSFDDEHRLRFCLFSAALEIPEVAQRLPPLCLPGDGGGVLGLLQNLTNGLKTLTVAVLRESDIRLEEFARHFCAAWRLSIEGETAAASAARLYAIDFGRLIKEAEAARASADERLAYLRKLQEEQEQTRRPRRGKW